MVVGKSINCFSSRVALNLFKVYRFKDINKSEVLLFQKGLFLMVLNHRFVLLNGGVLTVKLMEIFVFFRLENGFVGLAKLLVCPQTLYVAIRLAGSRTRKLRLMRSLYKDNIR